MNNDVLIDRIQPNPVFVHSGDKEALTVSLSVFKDILGARLVITNRQPSAARLSYQNEYSDTIRSDSKDLSIGIHHLTYTVGFKLEPIAEVFGAIIGLEIYVEGSDGQPVSKKRKFLATIGA